MDTDGELPEGWAACELGDFADVVGGGTPKTSEPQNFCDRGHAWITPADLSGFDEMYISRGRRDLSDRGLQGSSARLMPPGAVLMSSRAPIGYVAVANNTVSTNQGFKSFVCGSGVLPEYVYFWLTYMKPIIEEMGSGSTFTEISGSRAKEIPALLPPTAEQRRIVGKVEELLSQVNAARDRLRRTAALLKRFRQSALAAACDGRLTADWRVGGSANGDLPEAWRLATVESLLKYPQGLSYGILKPGKLDPKGVPMLRVVDIGDQVISYERVVKVKPELAGQYERTRLEEGDLLLAVMATVGRTAVVPRQAAGWNVNRALAVLKLSATVDPHYLCNAFRSPYFQQRFDSTKLGSAQPRINLTDLRQFEVTLPPLVEQQEIVRRVDALFSLADAIESRVVAATARAQRLTQSILAKAFRGELVPTEAELARREGREYEPASALLERIKSERARRDAPLQGRLP